MLWFDVLIVPAAAISIRICLGDWDGQRGYRVTLDAADGTAGVSFGAQRHGRDAQQHDCQKEAELPTQSAR